MSDIMTAREAHDAIIALHNLDTSKMTHDELMQTLSEEQELAVGLAIAAAFNCMSSDELMDYFKNGGE